MKQQFEKRIKELTATGTKVVPKAADVEAQIQAVRVSAAPLLSFF